MTPKELRKRAEIKLREVEKMRADPRYQKTIGALVRAGLLEHNQVRPFRGLVTVEDALWAGQYEPRIYELLPAVLLKKPRIFTKAKPLPADLLKVMNDLRRNKPTDDFRGIPPRNYSVWVTRVGAAGRRPSLLKTFRFNEQDVQRMSELQSRTGETEISILRKSLELLQRSLAHAPN